MSVATAQDVCEFGGISITDSLVPSLLAPAQRMCEKFVRWELERASYTRYYPQTEPGGAPEFFPEGMGAIPHTGGRREMIGLGHKYVLLSGLVVQEFSGAYADQYDDTDWSTLTLGDQYVLDLFDANVSRTGMILRLGGKWPRKRGSVKVTYTAGFSAKEFLGDTSAGTDHTDASDIRLAVILTCMKLWNELKDNRSATGSGRASGGLTSESIPGYSYTRGSAAIANRSLVWTLPVEARELLAPYRSYKVRI